jgi:hypothetical protein
MQHDRTAVDFGRAYSELGSSVQDQLGFVLGCPDAHAVELALEDGDLNPNALDLIVTFVRRWEGVLDADGVADEIESVRS